jgi:hypothetical protein
MGDVGIDRTVALDNLVDPPHRDTHVFRQMPNANSSRSEKLFQQNSTGMDWG